MIQIYTDGVLAYDSRLERYDLEGLTITKGLNLGGTAEITMPPGHPAYNSFTSYRTIVEIYRDGVLRFRGRALYPADDFQGSRTITCEGEMCLLRDGISRPYLYQDAPAEIFTAVIQAYNDQVEPFKQFEVGEVNVTDPNDYIRLESEEAETILDTVNKLLERCGGYILFTTDETGARVINWQTSSGARSNQILEFGENLLDFARTGANTEGFATGLIPYGAKNEASGKRVTIEKVNNGVDYILAPDAQSLRGTIMTTVTWDDVTQPANLYTKAQEYLQKCKLIVTSLELTALDLSYFDKELDMFTVGDTVRAVSKYHGLNEDFQLTQMTEDLLDPSKSRIVLGKDIATLTGSDAAEDAQNRADLEKAKVQIRTDYTLNQQQFATEMELAMTSKITQSESDILLEVSKTYTTQTAHEELSSRVELLADSITLEVTGRLGGTAQIVLAADGRTITQSIDMTDVRLAFANDQTAVTISGGTVTFNSGTFVVNSTNLKVSADGTITATNAELSGNLTTSSGLHTSKLHSGRLRFFYDGTEYGGIASTYYASDNTKRGIELRTEADAAFISFSIYDQDAGTYSSAYVINYGMNPSDYTERHLFYGHARFTDTAGNPLLLLGGAQVRLGHTTHPVNIYGSAINLNNPVYCKSPVYFSQSVVFDNVYGVRLYKADKSAHVMVLNMSATDYVRFGNADYQTRLYGSTVHIYGATTMHNAVTCSGSLTFANGYGVQIKNAAGAANYVLSFSSSDQCFVGAESYKTYLRGTAVYLYTSGATVTSDRRKKNSIEQLPAAYEAMLDKINPVRFKYTDGTSGRYHTGFIAQEVQEALEAAGLTAQDFGGFVDLNGDGEELGLIYTEFVALLLLKIKRQEQRIAALEAAH